MNLFWGAVQCGLSPTLSGGGDLNIKHLTSSCFLLGLISMDEFRTMWKLFNTHYNVHIDDSQIDELANTMDFNKDGSIDFNEFLKAFYVVHK